MKVTEMPKSKKYWERRKAENMWRYMESAEDCGDEIDLIYEEAMKYLIGEGNKIFTKVMDRYGLSDKEAKKILSKSKSLDLKDVKKEIRKGIPTEEKQKLLSEIESPAYAFRIKRFERMQDNIEGLMRDVYKREKRVSTRHYTDLAEESYNRNNFYIQQRLGVGFEVPQLNEKKIDRLLKSKWSGKNYSKRIWGRTQDVADKLKREMVISLMTGKTNREVAKSIEERFGSTAYQARRLVRTESCYIANQTEIMSYEDSGIEKYEYCATLDLRTSPQCQKLDGKIFKVKDAQAGVNLPPMHPFCRSTTLAYFDDDIEEEVKAELGEAKETRRAYIPKENDSELIENMSYEEWKKKYVVEDIDYENVKQENVINNKEVEKVSARIKKEATVKENNDIQKELEMTMEQAKENAERQIKKSEVIQKSSTILKDMVNVISQKNIENNLESAIMKEELTKEVVDVYLVGKIDREIFRCITEDIVTDEVIITDERISHIKDRHPNDYEVYYGYLQEIIKSPDYIIEANKPNTALILKNFSDGEKQFKTILRLVTSTDNPVFKNSIITFMKINNAEWNRLLRNKKILYNKE